MKAGELYHRMTQALGSKADSKMLNNTTLKYQLYGRQTFDNIYTLFSFYWRKKRKKRSLRTIALEFPYPILTFCTNLTVWENRDMVISWLKHTEETSVTSSTVTLAFQRLGLQADFYFYDLTLVFHWSCIDTMR